MEVHHSFLPPDLFKLAGPSLTSVSAQNIPAPSPRVSSPKLDLTHEDKHKDLPWHRFNPLPYATSLLDCSSLGVSCRVEDLVSLAHFLKGSMDVRVCMVRVVYAREAVPVQGVGKPQSAKPERGTPQSGRSSAAKVHCTISFMGLHQLVLSSLPFSISLSPPSSFPSYVLPSPFPYLPSYPSPHTFPFCAEVSTKHKGHQRQRKDGC